MFLLVLTIIFLIASILGPRYIKDYTQRNGYSRDAQSTVVSMAWARYTCSGVCGFLAFLFFALTSVVFVGQDEVVHMTRIYGGSNMSASQVIAAPWQKGAQARILTPGFKLMPFVKVFYQLNTDKIVEVPEGSYGFLVAKDGAPLRENQYIADSWSDASQMIDAEKFLGFDVGEDNFKGAKGQKGPQLTVLPPGKYRINRFLFDVSAGEAIDIPAGYVGVVKSNVGEQYTGKPILPTGVDASNLSVPIVPKGNQGVWIDVLTPGRYYMNARAYQITQLDTRVQTWEYAGGYVRRFIDLVISDNGKIEQQAREQDVPKPENAVDIATILRIENWDVYQDSRVQIQVTPENAPFVVAAVGSIEAIEDKIITPSYRSIVRNVTAENIVEEKEVNGKKVKIERQRQVLDLLYNREDLETLVLEKLKPAAASAGLTVQWVRFGDPVIPPELLIPGKRTQLAKQLEETYKQEKAAQLARVETEKERAKADQQAVLMESEIGIQVATNQATSREKAGVGEEKYLKAIARGQESQASVLGKDRAAELAALDKILTAAIEKPEMIKYPSTLVLGSGSGSSLEGAAAILGNSNLTNALKVGK